MAKVHCSFTMDVSPDRAQDMFGRDIAPNLHDDGEFSVRSDKPGRLEMVEGAVEPGAPLDLTELSDPDVVGHEEEDDEPEVSAVTAAHPASAILVGGRGGWRRGTFRHLTITFTAEAQGTRVTIEGHAPHKIREGLQRLGRPGHWPETAGAPHD